MERALLSIVFAALTLTWGGYPRGLESFLPAELSAIGGPLEKALDEKAVAPEEVPQITVWVTAYSSTPEETDETPFITAYGTEVRDGIIASNFLPFGTKVQIPELFGDRIFVVEDRMHRRKSDFIDIWMSTKEAAQEFGIHQTEIVVVDHDNVLALAK